MHRNEGQGREAQVIIEGAHLLHLQEKFVTLEAVGAQAEAGIGGRSGGVADQGLIFADHQCPSGVQLLQEYSEGTPDARAVAHCTQAPKLELHGRKPCDTATVSMLQTLTITNPPQQ